MAEKVVLTCDKCGFDEGVTHYSIGVDGSTSYEVDLCERCGEPIRPLIEIGRKRAAGLGNQYATGALREPELRSKVYDPEELDRMEEEYRRKNRRE